MKIGVFDSGVGGMTVLAALRKRFPGASYVYLGDTANLPYGTKSPAQIKTISSAAVSRLDGEGLGALVVACNTASSLALDEFKNALPDVPVFGVVTAGVQATLEACLAAGGGGAGGSAVLVLATRATVRSGIYSRLLRQGLGPEAVVLEQACPLLVPIIEEGWIDHPVLHQTIAEYVGPHAGKMSAGVALLACTHYPWIQAAFAKALPGWTIVNSANAVADLLAASMPRLASAASAKAARPSPTEWIFTDPDAVPSFVRDEFSAT